MLWPILSAISCLAMTATLCLGGVLALYPSIRASMVANPNWHPSATLVLAGLFAFYVANYSVVVFFNTALVAAASIRLSGGTPTLRDGLRMAWARK